MNYINLAIKGYQKGNSPLIYKALYSLGLIYLKKGKQIKYTKGTQTVHYYTNLAINSLNKALEIIEKNFHDDYHYKIVIQEKLKTLN